MAKRRGNGEGSVYRRKDGKYVAEVTIWDASGKRKRVKRSSRTKTEARERLNELQELMKGGVDLLSGDSLLKDYLERWLEDSVKPSVRQKTYEGYESICRVRIIPRIGRTKLSKVTPALLQNLYAELSKSGLSPRSVGHTHRCLHRAFEVAIKWNLLARNPCDVAEPPRVKRSEMKTLTREQLRLLLDGTAGERYHTLYLLAATTGLRLGELHGLKWSDIDLQNGRLFVRRSLQQTRLGLIFEEPKTSSSRRSVELTERAIAGLKDHRRRQAEERLSLGPAWEDNDLVFPNEIGQPKDPSTASSHLKLVLSRLGLPRIRFHDLRHTFASLLLQSGESPKVIQEILGHEDVTLTLNVYAHTIPQMQSRATRTMESIVSQDDFAAAGGQ
jgi:integrase